MRRAIRIALGCAVAVLLLALLQIANAESGEVIVLRTVADDGRARSTRLWVVDDAGAMWVRARRADTRWVRDLVARPEAEVVRDGRGIGVSGAIVPDAIERIDRLMAERYGVNEHLRISALLGSAPGTPVRLEVRDR